MEGRGVTGQRRESALDPKQSLGSPSSRVRRRKQTQETGQKREMPGDNGQEVTLQSLSP